MPSLDDIELHEQRGKSVTWSNSEERRSVYEKAWSRSSLPTSPVTELAQTREEFQREARAVGDQPNTQLWLRSFVFQTSQPEEKRVIVDTLQITRNIVASSSTMRRRSTTKRGPRVSARVSSNPPRNWDQVWRDSTPHVSASITEEGFEDDIEEVKFSDGTIMLNIIAAVAGASLLTMPYAFTQLGWAAIVLCYFLGAVMCSTAILLAWCAEETWRHDSDIVPTYTAMANLAFGRLGELVVRVVATFELFMVMIGYMAINCKTLKVYEIFAETENYVLIVSSSILTMILLTRPPQYLGWFSLLGLGAIMLTYVFIVTTGVALDTVANDQQLLTNDLDDLFLTLGVILFSFSNHTAIPSQYYLMHNKENFTRIAIQAFTFGCTLFAVFGGTAYFIFGSTTSDNVQNNIGKDLRGVEIPQLQYLSQISSALFILKVMLSFPLFTIPLVDITLELLPQSALKMRCTRLVLQVVLLSAASFFAWLSLERGNLGNLLEAAAWLTSVPTAIILPALMYWRLFRHSLSTVQIMLLLLVAIFGTTVGAGRLAYNLNRLSGSQTE